MSRSYPPRGLTPWDDALKDYIDATPAEELGWHEGTGSPESVVVADRGEWYRRTDGGPGTTWYLKEAEDGENIGWTAMS